MWFSDCFSKVDKLPRFGLVSPLKAQEMRVRVVPIIGREVQEYVSYNWLEIRRLGSDIPEWDKRKVK